MNRQKAMTIIFTFGLIWVLLSQAKAEARPPVAKERLYQVIKDTQNSILNRLTLQASDADAEPLTYIIQSLPLNGTLKNETEGTIIDSTPYALLDSNLLSYLPNSGFTGQDSFTFIATDGLDDSNLATVNIEVVPWFAPVGIPEPDFGIEQSHLMYADPRFTYDYGSGPQAYIIGENGPYTHYIDNTHPYATDANNPYGTPELPRLTIPYNPPLPAGSVVEVHGGPYTYGVAGSDLPIRASGTREQPVFIRGTGLNERPILSNEITIQGTYLIMEYIDFDGEYHPSNGPVWFTAPNEHIAIRHSEAHNLNTYAFAPVSGDGVSWNRNIVLYNNWLHITGPQPYDDPASGDSAGGGIVVFERAERVWALDNHIHHTAGPGIGLGEANSDMADSPRYLYVGRNVAHHNRQASFALKKARDVVISQNLTYANRALELATGTAPAIGIFWQDNPQRVWVLFNEVYDSDTGIAGSTATDVYIVGNVIYDIHDTNGYTGGYAIELVAQGEELVAGNTIYDVDKGIRVSGGELIQVVDNIISSITAEDVHMDIAGYDASRLLDYNLFYQDGEPIYIQWQDTPTDGHMYELEEFQEQFPEQGQNSLNVDPLFVDSLSNDFHLQTIARGYPKNSPARNAGVEPQVYNIFLSLYGLDIRKDFEGSPRPQGAGWDIGAFESSEYSTLSAELMPGDVSDNEEVSAYDAALAARYVAGLISLTEKQLQAAEVSGNARVTIYDAQLIARFAVGLIDEFPVYGDFDADGDVDLDDFAVFSAAYTGPGGRVDPQYEFVDFDGDGDVDLSDFSIFVANYTGPR